MPLAVRPNNRCLTGYRRIIVSASHHTATAADRSLASTPSHTALNVSPMMKRIPRQGALPIPGGRLMRGCPAVMGIVRLRWGVSAFRAYTARRRVLTSRRRGKQPRYSFPDASPQHHAPLNTRRQHCAIALNSTSEKCSKKCSRTPARWVGWASPRRSSPVSVRTAHAPRRSSGHGSLRTNPSASRHLSNRLSPLLRGEQAPRGRAPPPPPAGGAPPGGGPHHGGGGGRPRGLTPGGRASGGGGGGGGKTGPGPV